MRVLGTLLALAGILLLSAAVTAPGPFIGLLLGPLLIGAGYWTLNEGARRARERERRRRRTRRPGYIDRPRS